MRMPLSAIAALIAASLAASIPAGLAAAGDGPKPEHIPFPAGFDRDFIRYAVIDQPARRMIRFLYVNPEAYAAAEPGLPLPSGTTLVMAEAWAKRDAAGAPLIDRDGRMIAEPGRVAIFVQRKERGWGEGQARRNGAWGYAVFTPAGERRATRLDGCFSCHGQARAAEDYVFVFWDVVQARLR